MEKEIVEQIARLAEIEPGEVRPDAQLRELGVDSLMVLEIVAFIEKKLRIQIPEEEIQQVRTLADILEKIRGIRKD